MYVFTVAAGILPAVEPGILPGGYSCGFRRQFLAQRCHSGRQDAALYGSQDGRRYARAHHGKHILQDVVGRVPSRGGTFGIVFGGA